MERINFYKIYSEKNKTTDNNDNKIKATFYSYR